MIQSMTGFARKEGSSTSSSWVWELRSVNGKSLDLRFRLPSGLDQLETRLKEVAAGYLQRGNIQVSLQLEQSGAEAVPVLNEAALDAAVTIARKAAMRADLPMPGVECLLGIKGVVEYASPQLEEKAVEAWHEALIDSFDGAVSELAAARRSEGKAIAGIVTGQINQIEKITRRVKDDPSRSAQAIRQRLADNVAALLEASDSFDEHRLYHEAAVLATKADLQEELDRLDAHIASARELLKSETTVGRRLDFLAQEFNRECNTICSKSNAAAVTAAGLEMKVVIDQFREQIQNLQ